MKDRKITFRVTQEEYTLIDEMKKTETRFTYGGRWDMSAYIRNLVLSQTGKKDVRVDMELKDLNYQVRKIGVNINQIAHRLNSNIGDMRDAEYVVELMKELNARLEKLTSKSRDIFFSAVSKSSVSDIPSAAAIALFTIIVFDSPSWSDRHIL